MSVWDAYPATYRQAEVLAIQTAARAGECSALAGLSGSGKSNLLGFLANRVQQAGPEGPAFVLVDCNRLAASQPGQPPLAGLFELTGAALAAPGVRDFDSLQAAVRQRILQHGLCLLFDRFDLLVSSEAPPGGLFPAAAGNLRALRDLFKYDLTYVIAARRPLEAHNELAELFFAHTLWLGPLEHGDARWSVERYTQRLGLAWETAAVERLIALTGGYPAFLRAACEAYADGCPLELDCLAAHPAVQRRLNEFLADRPSPAELAASRLAGLSLLAAAPAETVSRPQFPANSPASTDLTAKEHLLWLYFQAHPHQVCEKDDLIRAAWPEDRIFERGIRDDSLAQLIRRLREKVEKDPSNPYHIHTIPGRGYRFTP